MSDQPGIVATKTRTTFRQECIVSAVISATPEKFWQLLTDVGDMVRWNSTLTGMEGTVELGGTVKMRVPEAPSRVFSIQVTKYTPNREMVWTQGYRVMFIGVRTYRLNAELEPHDHLSNERGLLRLDGADGCRAVARFHTHLRAICGGYEEGSRSDLIEPSRRRTMRRRRSRLLC